MLNLVVLIFVDIDLVEKVKREIIGWDIIL